MAERSARPGMEVLVTRPAEEGLETAADLAACGFVPVLAPLRHVEPAGQPPPALVPDALIATSRNAFLGAAGWPDGWRALPVHCVGPSTAAAAAAAGFTVRIVGEDGAGALARELVTRVPAGARLLYIAGVPRLPALEQRLAAAGFRLAVHVGYRVFDAARLPAVAHRALAGGRLGAVTHFSAESARTCFRLAADAGVAAELVRLVQACLAPAIAEVVRGLAGPDLVGQDLVGQDLVGSDLAVIVADRPTSRALAEALRRRADCD